ncbi:MAG TPA: ABC transporter permease, partial [Acidimicrobiales bacterium]|nr:ABC transporter permease [Acidimicrobiales bacterium]
LFVNPWENFRTIAMPALVLAAEPAAIYQRLLRGDAERTLREDYITMAYSKGISSRDVLLRHALRPSLFSTVTLAGLTTARLMGGAIVVESIFALPGIGSWLVDSIRSSDFPSVQAAVVIFAIFYVVINTLVDLSYRLLDPRTKAAR